MTDVGDPLARLIGEFSRLPGIGTKTANRLAHHLLKLPASEARALADALIEVKERLFPCSQCNIITDIDVVFGSQQAPKKEEIEMPYYENLKQD